MALINNIHSSEKEEFDSEIYREIYKFYRELQEWFPEVFFMAVGLNKSEW